MGDDEHGGADGGLHTSVYVLAITMAAIAGMMYFALVAKRELFRDFLRKYLGASARRTSSVMSELVRKGFHFSGMFMPALYYAGLSTKYMEKPLAATLVGIVTFSYLAADVTRLNYEPFNRFLLSRFRSFMRREEASRMTGIGFYMLGNFLSVLVFHPKVAILAMMSLILGDFSAALVGKAIGRTKLVGKKSLEGALGCMTVIFLESFAVVWYLSPSTDPTAGAIACLVGAFSGTLAELVSINIDDNLSIPLATGASFTITMHLLGESLSNAY